MKTTLILTTIHIPTLLDDYIAQAKGHDVSFIVAGDLKTPPEARTFCEERGVEYMGKEEQLKFLEPYPKLRDYLPWNSVQRRNVATLKAYKDGADVIITIDDDNFCADTNWFHHHMKVGERLCEGLWFNVCKQLVDEDGKLFFPRGFPLKERYKDSRLRTVVNAGLWLGEPDIDAITRMAISPKVVEMKGGSMGLPQGVWCPFNSQNTALHRDVIPAYFMSPHVGRFDDIWASYLVQRLAMENGDVISFGRPLVRQDRNPHDFFKDLELEMFGMRHTDDFCEQLRAARITQKDYKEGCLELLGQIKGEQYEEFIRGYRIWLSLF